MSLRVNHDAMLGRKKRNFRDVYAPAIFSGEAVGGAYSITTVHNTYVRTIGPSRPVRSTNGFRLISFEKISVLD